MAAYSLRAEEPFVDPFAEAYRQVDALRTALEALVSYESAIAELRKIPRLESLLREMVRQLESIGSLTSRHLPELRAQREALEQLAHLLGMGTNQGQLSDAQQWLAEGIDRARELVDRARREYHPEALVNRGAGLDEDARRALDAADRRLDDSAAMVRT